MFKYKRTFNFFFLSIIFSFYFFISCNKTQNTKIDIKTDPPRAKVYINNVYYGKTPIKKNLTKKKNYKIKITHDNYYPFEANFTSLSSIKIREKLELRKKYVKLNIEPKPDLIYINKKKYFLSNNDLSLLLPIGTNQIFLYKKEYLLYEKYFSVNLQKEQFNFKLIKYHQTDKKAHIITDPISQVYLEGYLIGESPIEINFPRKKRTYLSIECKLKDYQNRSFILSTDQIKRYKVFKLKLKPHAKKITFSNFPNEGLLNIEKIITHRNNSQRKEVITIDLSKPGNNKNIWLTNGHYFASLKHKNYFKTYQTVNVNSNKIDPNLMSFKLQKKMQLVLEEKYQFFKNNNNINLKIFKSKETVNLIEKDRLSINFAKLLSTNQILLLIDNNIILILDINKTKITYKKKIELKIKDIYKIDSNQILLKSEISHYLLNIKNNHVHNIKIPFSTYKSEILSTLNGQFIYRNYTSNQKLSIQVFKKNKMILNNILTSEKLNDNNLLFDIINQFDQIQIFAYSPLQELFYHWQIKYNNQKLINDQQKKWFDYKDEETSLSPQHLIQYKDYFLIWDNIDMCFFIYRKDNSEFLGKVFLTENTQNNQKHSSILYTQPFFQKSYLYMIKNKNIFLKYKIVNL